MISRIALFAALVTLAACANVTAPSGPPIAGDNRGSAAPPLRTEGTALPHSANASAGTPAITGNTGEGRPVVTRSAHAFADPGLTRAVADYLRRERAYVAAEQDVLDGATPFRRGGEED